MLKLIFAALAVITAIFAALTAYLFIFTPAPGTGSYNTGATTVQFTKPFTLTDMNGNTVTETTYLGKPTLWFFGFTHCPDICPTTLGTLAGWLEQLGPDAAKLNVVFVSIDPARDTPENLKQYVTSFHPGITAATGTEDQLRTMTGNFMVYYAKVAPKPGEDADNYMMNHSTGILMADANGTFKGMLDAHDPDDIALCDLRKLINP
jgi:protein SCO1